MTLEEFLDWYPDGYGRFELHDGVVAEMQPTGPHERVERSQAPYYWAAFTLQGEWK